MMSMTEEGRWSNLSDDILALILNRLHTKFDLCRFRSICKSWRSFASHSQPHLFFPLSLPPIRPNSRPFSLYPTLLYLFSPNPNSPFYNSTNNVWLVKVSEAGKNRWVLLNPLTNHKLYLPSGVFLKRINLLGFRNFEVGRSYKLQSVGDMRENIFDFEGFSSAITLRKVVVQTFEGIVVLGLYENGQFALWKSGDGEWKIIEIGQKDGKEKVNPFDDILCYGGRFYAVDRQGRLAVIDQSTFELTEVIAPVEIYNRNQYTYLVESNFRLYLVMKVVIRPLNYYDEEEEEWIVDKTTAGRPLAFKVYVFSEREKRWERVESLGNRVFFVSRDAAFSVHAEDLGWSKGNCIYFEGLTGYDDEADMAFGLNAGVYSLENQDIATFSSLADPRTGIFLPPSNWFVQAEDCPEYEMLD